MAVLCCCAEYFRHFVTWRGQVLWGRDLGGSRRMGRRAGGVVLLEGLGSLGRHDGGALSVEDGGTDENGLGICFRRRW